MSQAWMTIKTGAQRNNKKSLNPRSAAIFSSCVFGDGTECGRMWLIGVV
jgi:hypothetical protein